MPVTVSSVSPAGGHTGGRTFVEIEGTGFVLPPVQDPVNGITPPRPISVGVWFGSVPALAVFVLSDTLVQAVSPPQAPTADAAGRLSLPTVVDITVANVDDRGLPISGESATVPSAFTYQLPDLTDQSQESDLVRLIRTWLQLLKSQITPNVSWPTHTDFDQDTSDFLSLVDLPQLPGLVVSNVVFRDSAFARRDPVDIDNGDGTFTTKAPPDDIDVVLTVVGVSNNPTELLNLVAVFRRFMRKNPYVVMPRDPTNLALGTVKYPHNWKESSNLSVTSLANASNLSHFAYDVSIEGFEIEDMPGLPLGGPGDDARQHEATIALSNEAETITILPTLQREPG